MGWRSVPATGVDAATIMREPRGCKDRRRQAIKHPTTPSRLPEANLVKPRLPFEPSKTSPSTLQIGAIVKRLLQAALNCGEILSTRMAEISPSAGLSPLQAPVRGLDGPKIVRLGLSN